MHRSAAILASIVVLIAGPLVATAAGSAVSDSLYNAHHPRLLFTASELPALRAKVTDGGYDDDAYDLLRYLASSYYPSIAPSLLMSNDAGFNAIPNLGVAAHLESPPDTAAMHLGRDLIVYLADNSGVDNDEAGSGLRLRALALGYDMFFSHAPESLRTRVRDEIVDYAAYMTTGFTYQLFTWRPYLANHTAMFAGPLGLASICLRGEANTGLLDDAMAAADAAIDSLLTHQFDPGGAYKEGCLYGAWTLRQLCFYFDARKRYDGFDYSTHAKIRAAEEWFAYELLPEGWGKTNNLNDSPYTTTPLARHSTYFDWAQTAWNSGLSAWIWEHTAGPYGIDFTSSADKAATALYNRGLVPVQPDSVLPRSRLWEDRGLYYYRTGWQSELASEDVVFSFYSGKFHGGHAQEDQNQFTLYAYGGRFAIDHGAGPTAKQSESHNIVFVDGAGQHNAGGSIGTDGRIAAHLLGGFADYLQGDATAAYTTYSEFNAFDWPFPGWDWSWGHHGANPVLHARRGVIAVHGGDTPPWFVVTDDIDKDGGMHEYAWRLHTIYNSTVDVSSNPLTIEAVSGSTLDIHVLSPEFTSLTRTTQAWDNGESDPNSTLIELSYNAVNPRFAFLLFPSGPGVAAPAVTRETTAWGSACRLDWGSGKNDFVIDNHTGGAITWGPDSLRTDASIAVVRTNGTTVTRHILADATTLEVAGVEYVRFYDAPVTCALSGGTVHFDRSDAAFRLLDTGVNSIECRGEEVVFFRESGYVVSDSAVFAGTPPPLSALAVSVSPNPFNPEVTIRIESPPDAPLRAIVYDAAGRRVRVLMDATPAAEATTIRWNGTDATGSAVSSGVYFLKVTSGGAVETRKLVVVK